MSSSHSTPASTCSGAILGLQCVDHSGRGCITPCPGSRYSFERLRRRLGRLWALRLLLDLVLHRVHGAHSTRGWIERLVSSRYGAPRAPEPLAEFGTELRLAIVVWVWPIWVERCAIFDVPDEITIDDVMKPTKWCDEADAPSRRNPAPCSIAVGEPRTIQAFELCQNPYRKGETIDNERTTLISNLFVMQTFQFNPY